jgi:acyl-[acyl carrier protein]--UDP-N-acetylglucosamine O-acyltransferase
MIHKLALIDPKAKIDEGVNIGAYSVIGPEVGNRKRFKNSFSRCYRRTHKNWKAQRNISICFSRRRSSR